MNEESQKILAELLKKASEGIDSAVSFSQAQIPDVVHQLLAWNFVTSLVSQLVAFFAIIFLAVILYLGLVQRGIRKEGSRWRGYYYEGRSLFWDEDGDLSFPGFMISLSFSVVILICLLVIANNFDWLKIWLAPKLYLIEYAASIVK